MNKNQFVCLYLPYMNESANYNIAPANSGKKKQVRNMFDRISLRYDLLNHLLSFNIDKLWRGILRRKLTHILGANTAKAELLDLATGTGDLAFELLKCQAANITAVDLSPGMLSIAKKKAIYKDRANKIFFTDGDAEKLCFSNNSFDAATVAFGIRNFEDLERGLSEILRVIRPGSPLLILEFSNTSKGLTRWYLNSLLPFIGRILSGDKEAYSYLPASIIKFPAGNDLGNILIECGYKNFSYKKLTLGICSLYTAIKPIGQ